MQNNKNPEPVAVIDPMQNKNYVFKFLSYFFDKKSRTATFVYQGIDNTIFTEKITFAEHPEAEAGKHFNALDDPNLDKMLDNAMFLTFILIGSSYYKAHPTPNVQVSKPIDEFQAKFFSKVFQEGLSQYAFENGLTRDNLAHFSTTSQNKPEPYNQYRGKGILSLQSGGKDSLLVAELMREVNINFTPWYVASNKQGIHPAVIDEIYPFFTTHRRPSIAIREIDHAHLKETGGLNGHVPVTYINLALAVVQAILNNQNIVAASIGDEGNEPHAMIGDLPVNHQWSKTWEAEQLFADYVKRYISENIEVGSPIRKYSELRIAELFVNKCWQKYGHNFSSCNVANYKQNGNNTRLSWCGKCAKCANSYLLFCPFLPPQELQSLFCDNDLFKDPELFDTFKGLLGVENTMKPFECIGSIGELRFAYHHRMKVDPIMVSKKTLSSENNQMEELSASIAQATKRLKLDRFLKFKNLIKSTPAQTTNYITADKNPTPVYEQKYDKNGNPLPLQLAEGWWQPLYADLPFIVPASNFDYASERNSQDFFRNFFEEQKNNEN